MSAENTLLYAIEVNDMVQDNSSKYKVLSHSQTMEKITIFVNSMLEPGLLESVELSVRKHKVTEITIGQNTETYLIPFADTLDASDIAKQLEAELVNFTPHNPKPRFFGIKYKEKINGPKKKFGLISSLFKRHK